MSNDDHLHSIIADYGDACAEMQAELDRLRKRVRELEGLFSHVGVETHKWFDPECGHEGCQSLVLKARAEQAEAQLAEANARIAELEAELARDGDQIVKAFRERYDRAERAEAERDALHLFSGAQAAVIKEMREALELVLKYEYEWLVPSSLADVARAALAPSPVLIDDLGQVWPEDTPVGREERHEMTSIGDKEPDADPAGREG